MDLLDALSGATRSQDAAEGRLYGAISGTVTTVETGTPPKNLCRVKAHLSGMNAGDETGWMMPMFFGGVEGLPRRGDPIVALFIDGDPNRGIFATTATSAQSGRASEHMVLGDALLPLLNYAIDEINNLKAKYNALQSNHAALVIAFNAQVYVNGGKPVAVADTSSQDSDANAGKFQRADGSTPTSSSSSVRVLSADQRVR